METIRKKVTCTMSMSLDNYVAGPNLTEERPFGDMETLYMHKWEKTDKTGRDEFNSAGAFIMGRNMYGPRGKKYDTSWKGWWGDNPPYHAPVFVLTHRAREPIEMEGGTTFYFITGGIDAALEEARKVAGKKPVSIAGGASVVNQYLAAGYIDEIWLHIFPGTVGNIAHTGPRLFENIPDLRMVPISCSGTELVTHIKYRILK